MKLKTFTRIALGAAAFTLGLEAQADREILNASIDISRELFSQLNPVFEKQWKEKTGETVKVNQSHQGSTKQARAILEGLEADVVTFNQVGDVQILHDQGNLIPADWQSRLPDDSSPYYSLTSFLVRKGNQKNIKDWDDLVRDDVKIVFPNPKTSGNARYTYLAAWAYADKKFNSDPQKVRDFVSKFINNVVVFDTGGRGATTSFVERNLGDVLITFEAETLGIRKQYGEDKFDVVTPSYSISALFPVTVVDKVVDKHKTRDLATAYLEFLYSEPAQEILAQNFYRPRNPEVYKKYESQFPQLELFDINEVFGSEEQINKDHFANGASFDQLLRKR